MRSENVWADQRLCVIAISAAALIATHGPIHVLRQESTHLAKEEKRSYEERALSLAPVSNVRVTVLCTVSESIKLFQDPSARSAFSSATSPCPYGISVLHDLVLHRLRRRTGVGEAFARIEALPVPLQGRILLPPRMVCPSHGHVA